MFWAANQERNFIPEIADRLRKGVSGPSIFRVANQVLHDPGNDFAFYLVLLKLSFNAVN